MTALPSEIAKLSLAERIELVEDLWDSIASEAADSLTLTDAQKAELRRRMQAHRDDPNSALPWESVRAELLGPRK
jgi:putative addiction module component (TIGR02574 family)